jgi:phage gp37-like protein
MIAQIEDAIIERIKSAQGLGYTLRAVESYAGQLESLAEAVRMFPAMWVAVKGSGKPERIGPEKWKVPLTVAVFVGSRNVRGERATRHGTVDSVGSYQMLEDVQTLLTWQDFGLAIDHLTLGPWRTLANGKLQGQALSVLVQEFGTAYVLKRPTEENIQDLLRIGLNYHLTPDDGTADAEDLVTLS